jgi:ribonuclease inhibitor
MRELILDGSTWQTYDDVYNAFFKVVGAPEWHGRNFDALIDSIEKGDINTIEVPYKLIITHGDSIGAGAQEMVTDLVDLIHEIGARGCPVEIVMEK